MKYATLLLGATLVLASIVAARAGDHWSYVCKGSIRVDAVSLPDNPDPEAQQLEGYYIGDKKIPRSEYRVVIGTNELYYRGRKCAGPFYTDTER